MGECIHCGFQVRKNETLCAACLTNAWQAGQYGFEADVGAAPVPHPNIAIQPTLKDQGSSVEGNLVMVTVITIVGLVIGSLMLAWLLIEDEKVEEVTDNPPPRIWTPTGAISAMKINETNWDIIIVRIIPSVNLTDVMVQMLDYDNNTVIHRTINLMGNLSRYGTCQGVYFEDVDKNGTLSDGDIFAIRGDESCSPFAEYHTLEHFTFSLIFKPNNEPIIVGVKLL